MSVYFEGEPWELGAGVAISELCCKIRGESRDVASEPCCQLGGRVVQAWWQ